MQKRDIEKLRMKTVMTEAFIQATKSPYQTIRNNAEQKLKFLQEEYKANFGEYSEEHIIKVEEAIKYGKKSIKVLIDDLIKLQSEGETEVWIDGTLLSGVKGNFVIMTNKPQM